MYVYTVTPLHIRRYYTCVLFIRKYISVTFICELSTFIVSYVLCYHNSACNLLSGSPSRPPVIAATPLSNTSFIVNWSIPDPSYNYTVIWTNLNTGVMDNFTVLENTNSYTVTGLSDTDNYNVSVTAVGECGMMTSDFITVYGM